MKRNALRIGFCGAHRVGKTTLAETLAPLVDLPFVRTSASAEFVKRGWRPDQPLTIPQRLDVQQGILDSFSGQWLEHPDGFISDRTPIDMAAYTLGDVTGSVTVDGDDLANYLQACRHAVNTHFDLLVVVQPGIALVHEAGKAALSSAYIEHLNALVMGLVHDPLVDCETVVLPRHCTELSDRIDALGHVIEKKAA